MGLLNELGFVAFSIFVVGMLMLIPFTVVHTATGSVLLSLAVWAIGMALLFRTLVKHYFGEDEEDEEVKHVSEYGEQIEDVR